MTRGDGTDRSTPEDKELRFVDIGANLLDPVYAGVYRGKERHASDLDLVLSRAFDGTDAEGKIGAPGTGRLKEMIISAGTLEESRNALLMARADPRTFSTVGVHPTRCTQEFGEDLERMESYVDDMIEVCEDGMRDGTVVAVGELGLDYDRLEFCDKESQKRGFLAQLRVAEATNLPLFLHNRNTGNDMVEFLREHRSRFGKGVVHSFDGSVELAEAFVDLDLFIGLNGCSLKKEENLEVVKTIPLDRLLLETDCPWCDIRRTHAGHKFVKTNFPTKQEKKFERGCCVKARYEPCHIIQVAEVVAGAKGITVEEVAEACYKNSHQLFSLCKKS